MGTLILILGCLVASAFFSGSETALLRLRQVDVEAETKEGGGPAGYAIRDLLSSTSRLLVTILLGNNVVNILGASLATALAVTALGPETGVAVATIIMACLVLILCEILPKAVAATHPRGVSRAVALPLYLIHQALRPMHHAFDRLVEPVVHRVSGGVTDSGVPDSTEELLRLARRARFETDATGPLAIIGAAAEAHERTVEEIMVPRTEVQAFPLDTSPAELLDRMLEERYTRVPIFEESIDRVHGVVHFKDLVKLVRASGTELRAILNPVLRVPERKPILRLLTDMQRSFVHMAIVKDEHGVTQGIVTQEDILEEIVGEIRDEFDREELRAIQQRSRDEFEALGRVTVLDFNRETGWELPAEPGDTLSGVVFNELGRSPLRGDVVHLPGYAFTVVDLSGTRIARVRVRRSEERPATPNEAAG